MGLKLEKEIEDMRGKILLFLQNQTHVSIMEVKKGFSRGGHYHNHMQDHIIISGKLEYREENIDTGIEQIKIIDKPTVLRVPPRMAHLFVALEDSVFIEAFTGEYDATYYPKYRKDVEDRMKKGSI